MRFVNRCLICCAFFVIGRVRLYTDRRFKTSIVHDQLRDQLLLMNAMSQHINWLE